MTISIGGAFALTDHHDRAVTEASFLGQFVLIFFGFTHCKVVCPRALGRISVALDQLGPDPDRIQPLYVTVDPERDTSAVMRAFLESRYPRFLGLTGEKTAIDAMKATYKVFAQRRETPDDPAGYDVPHTAFTYLLDPRGHYLAHFVDAGDAAELASRIAAAIASPT